MTIKLLVIDDSVNIQRIVGLAFSDEDAILEFVSDGEIAMDIVRDFRPDVALVDVFMPGCSGYDICGCIKEDPELADIAVVLLAGTLEPFDDAEASRVKCNGVLIKPFNTSDLLQTVHDLAEGRRQKQQAETEMESAGMDTKVNTAGEAGPNCFRFHNLVSPTIRDSFLGSDRILDLFDADQLNAAKAAMTASVRRAELQALQNAPSTESPAAMDVMFSENTLNSIVNAVLQRMSADVIRDVAWEVVPELSESIIRRTIEEQSKS
jgi:CheY-like chemotaxis protein